MRPDHDHSFVDVPSRAPLGGTDRDGGRIGGVAGDVNCARGGLVDEEAAAAVREEDLGDLIRAFGAYPDGIAFAVLLMNICVPLIDMKTHPPVFGHKNGGAP